jgi:hypothetical protein
VRAFGGEHVRRERRAHGAVEQRFEVGQRVFEQARVGARGAREVCLKLCEPRGRARQRLAQLVVAGLAAPRLARERQRLAALGEVGRDDVARERETLNLVRVGGLDRLAVGRGGRVVNRVAALCVRAALAFEPFAVLRLDLFLAVHERLDAAAAGLRGVRVEGALDAAQRDVQRHAHLLPALDQRPIHRTQQQVLAAPADEGVFDLREVVEVVQALARGPLPCGARALRFAHTRFGV